MPYLGNKPVNNFVSFAKQDITGNGGTSYSLDYPVTGANDIDLYINNVRQEPTEAYSCSGSTLTLTEAVSSSDDIYAIFRGRALQTANHPSDSALEASTANISGDTTLGDLEVTGETSAGSRLVLQNKSTGVEVNSSIRNHTNNYAYMFGGTNGLIFANNAGEDTRIKLQDSNEIEFITSSTNRMVIDSSGRVTKPYQPGFNASSGSQQFLTSSGTVVYANTSWASGFNTGSHYNTSNGRFTCPIDGVYLITCGFYKEVNTAGLDINVRVNGGGRGEVRAFTSSGDHESFSGTFVWKLSANDYIDLQNEQPKVHLNNTMSQFSVVLLS